MPQPTYRVLLVEDNPAHRYMYRRFLEQHEEGLYDVVEAASAGAALEACDGARPDCIVVDFRLPDTDGLALLPLLRSRTSAPIIFITAHPEPLTMTKAYREGATRYLSKDFLSSESLRAAVADALRL